jgi:HPt (histidine-containing phosphotransfer) domain-containing protein
MTDNNKGVPSIAQTRIDELRALLGDDVKLLIDEFFSVSDPEIEQLGKAIKEENTESIYKLCHSLKSSSGNLGFLRLHEQCKQLELQARTNQAIDADKQFTSIMTEYESLKEQLSS